MAGATIVGLSVILLFLSVYLSEKEKEAIFWRNKYLELVEKKDEH